MSEQKTVNVTNENHGRLYIPGHGPLEPGEAADVVHNDDVEDLLGRKLLKTNRRRRGAAKDADNDEPTVTDPGEEAGDDGGSDETTNQPDSAATEE